MADRFRVEIHHIIGGTVIVDVFKVPKGGRWVSHLKAKGRTILSIYDRRGRKVHGLQYRQVERIHWRSADG